MALAVERVVDDVIAGPARSAAAVNDVPATDASNLPCSSLRTRSPEPSFSPTDTPTRAN